MNVLKRIVTAPVRAVRSTKRLLELRDAGVDELELLDQAAEHPELYRDETWWRRVLVSGARLVSLIPLPNEGRIRMQNVMLKAGIALGAIGGLAGYLSDAGILQILPPKYAATIGVICGAAATGAAYLHPAPAK